MPGKIIVFLVLAVLLLIFTLQNAILVTIKLLFWEIKDVRLVYILIVGLMLGFLLALIMPFLKRSKLNQELKRMSRESGISGETKEDLDPDDEEVTSEGVSMGSDYKGGFF